MSCSSGPRDLFRRLFAVGTALFTAAGAVAVKYSTRGATTGAILPHGHSLRTGKRGMPRLGYLFLIFLIVGLRTPAWADFQAGIAAYDRGDYATALLEWRSLAEQGNADAQYNLGRIYGNGDGVPQDDVEAETWYRKAAEQGYAEAEHALGNMYLFDDPAEAIKWFRRAAERGYRDAWGTLAIEYFTGFSVPQDYAEAAKWIRKLADQGQPSYQVELGKMYKQGQGVPQDYVQAHMWFSIAVAQGYETRAENLDKVANEMTPEDISKAERLAREWLEKHSMAK